MPGLVSELTAPERAELTAFMAQLTAAADAGDMETFWQLQDERLDRGVRAAAAEEDWRLALDLASSTNRMYYFLEFAEEMWPWERPKLLSYIWNQCDNSLFDLRHEIRPYLIEAEWIGKCRRPTEPVTLFRGVRRFDHALGLSWTRKRKTARFFTHGRGPQTGGFVFQTTVPPEAVFGRFVDRGEDEYVVDYEALSPDAICIVEVIEPPESHRATCQACEWCH